MHACTHTRSHTSTTAHRLGFGVDFGVNTGDVREADKVKGADGCVYLSSQVNRRRRKLKRLDTDRSLTAAGTQVQ